MSTNQPGGPRRRRIAGERRGSASPAPEPTQDQLAGSVEAAAETPLGTPLGTPVETPVAEAAVSGHGTDSSGPSGLSGPSGWWGSRPTLVGLIGLLVVLTTLVVLGALGLLGNDGFADVRRTEDVAAAERSATAAAERAATAILAYDHRTLDADQDAATRFMTPDFAEEYTATFERAVKPQATKFQAQVTSEVKASAVVRAAPDRVRVLLFVDQTTVSTAKEGPQVALNRVEMMMVQRGDSWLVSDITSY